MKGKMKDGRFRSVKKPIGVFQASLHISYTLDLVIAPSVTYNTKQ